MYLNVPLPPPAPGDYRAVSEIISLSPTLSEACVDVEVEDDSAVESNEYLTVSLSPLDEGLSVELSPNSTTIYITDNDGIVHLFVYFSICLVWKLLEKKPMESLFLNAILNGLS